MRHRYDTERNVSTAICACKILCNLVAFALNVILCLSPKSIDFSFTRFTGLE